MSRLPAVVFGFCVVLVAADAEAWDEFLTGFDENDCSSCGSYSPITWPWSPTCRWSPPRTVRTGYYRERAGDAGSRSCHPESGPLPWSEAVSWEMGERVTYQLKQGAWEEFGFDFTASWTKTSSRSVTVPNSCSTRGCCLTPLKAFIRYSYIQKVRDREIATRWTFAEGSAPIDGGPNRVFFGFRACRTCNEQTRKFSVLCEHPWPELLPAEQGTTIPFPYDQPLLTAATLCTGSLP